MSNYIIPFLVRLPITDGVAFGLVRQGSLCVDSLNQRPPAKASIKNCKVDYESQVSLSHIITHSLFLISLHTHSLSYYYTLNRCMVRCRIGCCVVLAECLTANHV